MRLRIKNMERLGWKRVLDKEYRYQWVEANDFSGVVGLLHIKQVREPLYKRVKDHSVKVVGDGYYWLQFAYSKQSYWLTVMYNEQKEVVQYYFDVTQENHVLKEGKSYFHDLFLDVVMLPDGTLTLLDEDELEEALKQGIINQRDYDKAYETAYYIINQIKGKEKELRAFCDKYFEILLA